MDKRFGRQRGFAGIVYLVIGLIAVVMSGMAYMSRSPSASTEDDVAKAHAPILLKQSSDFKSAFDQVTVTAVDPANVTFDATPGTGMFDPSAGAKFGVRHVPPPKLAASGIPDYVYHKQVQLPGIASPLPDYLVAVGNLTLPACRVINRILYNDGVVATPATSSGTLADWTTSPAVIDDSASVAANYAGRHEGCIQTSDGVYVYYKSLKEN